MVFTETAIELLKESVALAQKFAGKVSTSIKAGDSNQVLTEADIAIGNSIVSRLRKKYPEHNIINEESGIIDNGSSYTWVIDPIDGTSNFAKGLPMYGTIIGLLKEGVPVLGGVTLPEFEETWIAEKGGGSFCNGRQSRVTEEHNLSRALVAYGIDGHPEDPGFTDRELKLLGRIINSIQNLRCTNSVFDAMMVAGGRMGGYLNQVMKIWDVVGPQVIIEEAGGLVTDFSGYRLDYRNHLKDSRANYTFFSAPPQLHARLLKLISG